MSKIYGISYVSRHFQNRYTNILNLGNNCGLFDEFKCFNENDIDEDFKKNIKMFGICLKEAVDIGFGNHILYLKC